jgi:hypothetical protein
MRHRRFHRAAGCVALVILASTLATPALAVDTAIIRSILIPGSGQAHKGHYTRAAVFSSAAVISAAGLLATQIHYDRAVESLDDQRSLYLGYRDQLEGGKVVSKSEIDATYDAMIQAYNDADDRVVWRNVFLTALVATYAVNIVDVIMSEPDTGELDSASGLSVEVNGTDVRVVRTFSF